MTANRRRAHTASGLLVLWIGFALPLLAWAADRAQPAAAALLQDIHRATWIAEGKGPHIAYVFFDPDCPYCHKLYAETRHWVKAGRLQLRWIPVGILTATSPGKAGAILDAKDPLAAFHKNEGGYEAGTMGGIDEALEVSPRAEAALKENAELLSRTGLGSVPALLFRADDGNASLVFGAPSQAKLDAILSHVK
jgi:thiol:disulfide interchange protein DsbG